MTRSTISLMPAGLDLVETMIDEGSSIAWQHMVNIGFFGTFQLVDLLSPAFHSRLMIFRRNLIGIDEFLRRHGPNQHQRNNGNSDLQNKPP
jgi:hypothetical protein